MKVVNFFGREGGIELIMKLGNHGESHPHSPAALISNSAVSPSAGQI